MAQHGENIMREIKSTLEQKGGWSSLSKIIDHKWTDGCFQNTNLVGRGTLEERKGNLAVIINPKGTFDGELAKDIQTNFPDVVTLLEEKLEEGSIEYIQMKTQTILSSGKRGDISRTLYLLSYEMDKGGINDIGKLYEIIEKLEKRATSDGIHQMNLVPIGNINIDYLQKCTESVFRGTNSKIQIIMDKEKQPNIRGAKGGSKTEKVIIKAGGKQYADILRTVKNSINIDQAGINVKTIKKTMRGDVMMEVKGGKEKAEALRQEILKKNEGTRVEITNQNGTVYVTGIDGDVTKNEIVQAIKDNVGGAVDASDIEVVSIRPTQYGRQNATVVIKTEWIKKLCAKETIRIGWTPCRIRQRINITRCYRCLEFGHQKWECQGEDKTRICLKCGENDHRAKDCVGQSFCFTCKTKGHRADQTRCPHYRKLIQEKTRDVIAGKGKAAENANAGARKRQASHKVNRNGVESLSEDVFSTPGK